MVGQIVGQTEEVAVTPQRWGAFAVAEGDKIGGQSTTHSRQDAGTLEYKGAKVLQDTLADKVWQTILQCLHKPLGKNEVCQLAGNRTLVKRRPEFATGSY